LILHAPEPRPDDTEEQLSMIRRAIGTTLVGLCALTGPLAVSALAADVDPAAAPLTLSVASVRPGVSFTVGAEANCPPEFGVQSVELSFTDSEGNSSPIGSVPTGADGSWSDVAVRLPVNGLDESGGWLDSQVAAGAGTVDAVCLAPDTSADDPDGDGGDTSTDPDDPSTDPTDPGDDGGGDSDGTDDGVITLTYASTSLTATGSAAALAVSPALGSAGGSITVTPAEGCAGTGAAAVAIAVRAIGASDGADHEPGEPLVTASATTTEAGLWQPVSITLPAGASTGDYAVSADCRRHDVIASSYDAATLALGTVLISAPVCTATGAGTRVSGSYSGAIAGGDDGLSLPTTLKLAGDGPWRVQVHSDITGQLLASRTLTCAHPRFDVDVAKTGVSKAGEVRARACNTGRAPVVAVLQVFKGKSAETVDRQSLAAGDCAWLEGGKLTKGKDAKAQVLLDPPGKGGSDTDVAEKFTVHRDKH
jgi:hypothetical protein